MKKISDAVRETAGNHPFLRFGISQKLFNLTKLAEFLKPVIESRLSKEASVPSILMALSRLGSELGELDKLDTGFQIDELTVHADLQLVSLERNKEARKKVNKIYSLAEKQDSYLTVTEGMHEITLLFHKSLAPTLKDELAGVVKYQRSALAGLGIRFSQSSVDTPGFLHLVLQQLAMQGVNLIEVASTSSEFIIYVEEQNIQLAFDSLYYTFRSKSFE